MDKKISILKYKKIIMLALIVISVVIIIAATYITGYNVNKVVREDVLTQDMSAKIYKSSEDFLGNFDEFKIYLSDERVYTKDVQEGWREFTVIAKTNTESDIKKEIYVTLGMGANWVKYISELSDRETVKIGEEREIKIENIEQKFPLKSSLLFTPKVEPTLYVLVEWSELNTNYYTYLEYDYKTYSIKPSK